MSNPKVIGAYSQYPGNDQISSAIASTALAHPVVGGVFRVSYYVDATGSAGAGTFQIVIGWQDSFNTRSQTVSLNTSGVTQGSVVVTGIGGQPITFEIDVTGFTTNPSYLPHIVVERLFGEY